MASTAPKPNRNKKQDPAAATTEAKLNRMVAQQLAKTKLCAMFARGMCNDAACMFAHSHHELRRPPDLAKTAMCRAFLSGKCTEKQCRFAHGEAELRVTPDVYKTQLCNFFERGYCRKGSRCRHAHGVEELRSSTGQPADPEAPLAESAPPPPPSATSRGSARKKGENPGAAVRTPEAGTKAHRKPTQAAMAATGPLVGDPRSAWGASGFGIEAATTPAWPTTTWAHDAPFCTPEKFAEGAKTPAPAWPPTTWVHDVPYRTPEKLAEALTTAPWPSATWTSQEPYSTPQKLLGGSSPDDFVLEPMKIHLPAFDSTKVTGNQDRVEQEHIFLQSLRQEFEAVSERQRTAAVTPEGHGLFTPPRTPRLLRFLDSPSSPWHPAGGGDLEGTLAF